MGLSKFEAIAAKCIGLDDLGPCPDIGFVDALDHISMAQVPQFWQLTRHKPRALKHGSHSAIKKQAFLF